MWSGVDSPLQACESFLMTAIDYAVEQEVLQEYMDAKNAGEDGLDQKIENFITKYLVPQKRLIEANTWLTPISDEKLLSRLKLEIANAELTLDAPKLKRLPKNKEWIDSDIFQPVTSPETIEYVPRAGHKAVYWLQNADSQLDKWNKFAKIRDDMGKPVAPGDDRCLVLNVHVGKTREAAMKKGKPGHDEFCRFLAPYGRFASYRNPDGSKVAFDHCPTVQESIDQKIQAIGSVDDVVDTIGFWRDLLDLKHLIIFFDLPGLTRQEMKDQLHMVAEEVMPKLGETMGRRPLPSLSPLV